MHPRLLLRIPFTAWVLSLTLAATAQTFQGSLDEVYPIRLELETNHPKASLAVSTHDNTIQFVGGCNAGDCKYRALDTALTLSYLLTNGKLEGRLQSGNGNYQTILAAEAQDNTAFSADCAREFRLQTWKDESLGVILTFANLPGGLVRGTCHVNSLATSFRVSGSSHATGLNLQLLNDAGTEIGGLTAPTFERDDVSSFTASLELDGTQTRLKLALSESLKMQCMQVAGRFDMVVPAFAKTEQSPAAMRLWKELVVSESEWGHIWFEPTRVDEFVISGWLHGESDIKKKSEPVLEYRRDGKQLKNNHLLGGARLRQQLFELAKTNATSRHPLQDEPGFKSWMDTLSLTSYTLTHEGVLFALERHPLYGQVNAVIPWWQLPKSDNLPEWLVAAP